MPIKRICHSEVTEFKGFSPYTGLTKCFLIVFFDGEIDMYDIDEDENEYNDFINELRRLYYVDFFRGPERIFVARQEVQYLGSSEVLEAVYGPLREQEAAKIRAQLDSSPTEEMDSFDEDESEI